MNAVDKIKKYPCIPLHNLKPERITHNLGIYLKLTSHGLRSGAGENSNFRLSEVGEQVATRIGWYLGQDQAK